MKQEPYLGALTVLNVLPESLAFNSPIFVEDQPAA